MGVLLSWFPTVCNMSLTASAVILAVLLARLLLRRTPKVFSYALWAVVLFRLLCPVSVSSTVSLMGALGAPAQERGTLTSAVEYVPASAAALSPGARPAPAEGLGEISGTASAPSPAAPADRPSAAPDLLAAMAGVWLTGAALLLLSSLTSMLRLRRRLVGAVRLRDNIYLADRIPSPFVMGLLRPRIYLPSTLKEAERDYILLHEQHHIRRRDHLAKLLAFLALCIHWFNPLVWLAFILSGRDMEMSCDEAVVRKLGEDIRADYSASLLSLSTGRRIVAGTPLAFGEGDAGGRIRNLLNWKRPQPWVLIACAAVCAGLIALCAANPESGTPAGSTEAQGRWSDVEEYAQSLMDARTEVQYYAEEPDGTAGREPVTAAVTDTKLTRLEKGGELAGLAPEGVLEEWELNYLVKFDADPSSVALAGGQYYDEEGYFDLDDPGGRVLVALRYGDGSCDILYDAPINDRMDFLGYHNTMEEALYDWYVTDRGLDLPLYVEDWVDQIDFAEDFQPGNYPVHRFDGDGWYLYIPIDTWVYEEGQGGHGALPGWISAYGTGACLFIDRFSAEEHAIPTSQTHPNMRPVDGSALVWEQQEEGSVRRDYYTETEDGGCWRVSVVMPTGGARAELERQVLCLMAESFTAAQKGSSPAAGRTAVTSGVAVQDVSDGGRRVELTVQFTMQETDGAYQVRSVEGALAKNISGWQSVALGADVVRGQIVSLDGGTRALVPVIYRASAGADWEKHCAVVVIDLTDGDLPRAALTESELETFRQAFEPLTYNENGDPVGVNPVSCFFSSDYGSVRELDFAEFLRYFPGGGAADEAEFTALKALDGWPFRNVERLDEMPVPITRIPAAGVDETLTRYAGITAADLTNTAGTFYLKDYDAYYVYTSDFGPGTFAPVSGERIADRIYLYGGGENGSSRVLTLRTTDGGGWQIVSFLTLDAPN